MNRLTRSKVRPELPTNAKTLSRGSFNSPKILKETAKHLRTIKRKSSQPHVTATPNPSVIAASAPADAVGPIQDADDDPPRVDENEGTLSDSPRSSSSTRAVIEKEKQRNKENLASSPTRSVRGVSKRRFIDPQSNAERVEPDTDISQDAGFEKDGRATDVPVRRNKKPPQKRRAAGHSRRAPKRARHVEEELSDAAIQQNLERNLERIPEPSQLANYKMASQQAKRIVARKSRKLQTRKPWTDEETETLIQLIEDEGTSWSDLKEIDEEKKTLKYRDQVALKDKARNIKFDFLKAGPTLPKNFEFVALNKMQVEKLRSLGIMYNNATGMREDADTEDE